MVVLYVDQRKDSSTYKWGQTMSCWFANIVPIIILGSISENEESESLNDNDDNNNSDNNRSSSHRLFSWVICIY